ncbi:MAG: ribosomal protein S18-alanine N-acetyltransferase [Beijerinckiaceae bacterium]|nr:ribosomal protein S18-alanine N-acetyltransferase [Beijerinckiaceae bacterium]
MQIRKASLDDLDAVERIENAVFSSDQLSRRSLRRYIGAPSAAMIVVRENDAVTGYALIGLRKGSKKASLYSIAVDTQHAGRGAGRALLQACEHEARARGCEALTLEVRADNPRAIALYERSGYERAGVEPDYYEDGASAYRFRKNLSERT